MNNSAGNAVTICWWVLLVLLAMVAAYCHFKVRRLRARLRMFEEVADTMMQNTQGLILNVHSIASRLPQDVAERQSIETVVGRAQDQLSQVRERVERSCVSRRDTPC
ncbi:hypothetical protein [Povalibacter sp.]|uniref:hypothetical protein n=1 Tax=Povalibacter sp. TaxID=1962978 RepID=UPI002F3E95A6